MIDEAVDLGVEPLGYGILPAGDHLDLASGPVLVTLKESL